ncbi:Ribonuclease J [Paenibacillus solanacearum]|uniref:Ribonuclease J n=1 Tax=Paenibacillus solanacearum TaxID=2048548 RepID=A0A916NLE7_9BACL|nr:hypothetical protein [Paenibacillus solanacearum]CAG7648013.1 Ribonuclease J [Paenibacillus solanacearum]
MNLLVDQLTFFGGADESGGVQILFGRGEQALLFDFGTAHHCLLDPGYLNLYDPVAPSRGREIRQYLLGKMAPPLPELFDPAQLEGLDEDAMLSLWDHLEFPRYKSIGVFVGHMHQDHMSLLPFARKGLQVYMNRDTSSLYRGIVYSGQYPDTQATIVPCDDLSVIDFGTFTVQIVEMDHNTVGASAIVIETPDHKIAITGDWRRHGRHPERVDRFIDLCRRKGIDLLMTEGTRVSKDPAPQTSRKETKSLEMYADIVQRTAGLVYLQMSPRDLERMADMIQIGLEKGRQIVMDGSHAALWYASVRDGIRALANHPALNAEIRVIDCTLPAGVKLPYETTSLAEVARHKERYVYFFKFPELGHLIELEAQGAKPGASSFIQADYSVKIDHAGLARFLQAYGIEGHSVSNKGHATPEEVSDLIEGIGPKAVVPVHTRHRKLLDTRGVRAYYPGRGETISITDLLGAAR